jgi:RNA recognition motif-containing protein
MNIYIGNLNYRVQEKDLRRVLEEYGEVSSVRLITDRDSGRSKGFAFAEMPDDDSARKAISELNDSDFDGRRMIIKEAIPKQR